MVAMERSEVEVDADPDANSSHWLWLHLSSQLIYFQLFQFASFSSIVMDLHKKVNIKYGFIIVNKLLSKNI